ncbi:DHA2 family efflux MFS transporter permease subunit [Pseudonocardiaceae bacterium YIM PH 21723]|nr:DHA2 family efflux MFS transporter permease subunit [Pseudonocardiaceae bacterium YIM PH 21723]
MTTVRTTQRGGIALTALCLGFLMITLDATIVNVALPAIQADVGGDLEVLQWVVDSYTIALAALLLSAGVAADRLGGRRAFLTGLLVFAIASVGCAFATDASTLILARAVQGIGAAVLLPASLALIAHQFPEPRSRAHALGVWGGVSGIGLAAGPVLGGLAVDLVGWQAIFLVNVPVVLLTVLLTRWTVTETPRRADTGLDPAGQVLGVATLGLLAGGLIEAGQRGWTAPLVVALLGAGVLSGALFLLVERSVLAPMLPLRIFASRPLSVACGIGLLFNFCLYGTLFVLALYLQQTRHLPAWQAGLSLLPLTAVIGVNAFLSGRVVARLGTRLPMIIGGALGAVGACVLAFSDSLPMLWVGSVVLGCCALAMPAMVATAMHALPAAQAGLASGVLNAARQSGGALGIAVLGSLLTGTIHLGPPLALVAVAYLVVVGLAATLPRSVQDHR